ncbi:MAG: glycoside hydrolase family 36 protein [Lentisphaeria bacterium]
MNTDTIIESFICGDMLLRYRKYENGQVSMELLPTARADDTVSPRPNLGATADAAQVPHFLHRPLRRPEPLVHVRRSGDRHGDGHIPGLTLRYSSSTTDLKFQRVQQNPLETGLDVVLELSTDDGLTAEHHVLWRQSWQAFKMWTEIINNGREAFALELVTSFSLGSLSPFAVDDAPGRLFVHRFRSGWSAEGRHERALAEALGLERAWAPNSVMTERFGQRGTKPVREFAPWVGLEDADAQVMWAAHLEAPGSWQCEIGRRDDGVNLAGGLADREFGHWVKSLAPGARFVAPAAWLTVCQGGIDDACARLLHQQRTASPAPGEENLPIIFNEWCTTWGNPSHDNLIQIADSIKETSCQYLVIDAGWYKPESGSWGSSQGDWQPSSKLFPHGLEYTCAEIRKRDLIPGLWFEFEVAGENSALATESDRFLTLDGYPILAGSRRFLDLRQKQNHELLETRVIDLIERCGIGYIKVDYNGSVGIGCDGAESLGEGLRQHVEGVRNFFIRLKERLPNLVIENCSSGGQRAEPNFGQLTDMHSFSDAHTCRDIPIVAANVARLVPARQNQIWAVVMPDEDEQRLVYSLAATFIGRMCLSGEIWHLDETRMRVVKEAMDFYNEVAHIIRCGVVYRYGQWSSAYRHLTGWQAVTISAAKGILVIVHVFGDGVQPRPIPLAGRRVIRNQLVSGDTSVKIENDALCLANMPAWSAAVIHVE